MIVKHHPINDFIQRLTTSSKLPSIQPAHFQRTSQAFSGRIIAIITFATHKALHTKASLRLLKHMATCISLHELLYALFAYFDTISFELMSNSRPAIFSTYLAVNGSNVR